MATDFKEIMEVLMKVVNGGENPTETIGHDTWLPEKRAKYNAKRRQKDLDFVYSNWGLPQEKLETKINIADVPAKVAKKHKRAVAVHGYEWARMDKEYSVKVKEMESRGSLAEAVSYSIAHGTSTLEQMQQVLPTYQSRTIVDIPPDFRKFSSRICEREISGNCSALNYLFRNNYYLASYYNYAGERTDDELSLHHVNEALSLLPTLQRGEVPHYDEVLVRTIRALATYCMKDFEAALMEYRVCIAAIRLLHHEGRIDMSDATDKLMNTVNLWPHSILRMTIRIKIQNGVSRPYLTKEEYLDLMKENAYGIYSPSSQKCFHCGNTEKLLLCCGCSNAWYCSKSCATKEWKIDHKRRCGSKRYTGTVTMTASCLQEVLDEIESKDVGPETVNSLGMSILNFGDRDFLVLCKDPSSGEIFDALTDETIEMQEGAPLPTLKSKLGGYHVFSGVPSNKSSQAESQE
ncbi:hypothetical protein QTG54_011818 [Skeletonema marinoi]|uniref:MYND-type domain-containing protein n=2 Tax=Skeletonema marinoi TaxID=267567 RepID=A0AAD9D840_9STRA|nr:hypothetical protein QTG54_011818 [Skeletonema marinoi]